MSKGMASFITALAVSIVVSGLIYLVFHFTGTKQISSNGVVLMFFVYTFVDILQRANKEL